MTPSLILLIVFPSCLCCSGPFPFLNFHSKSCLFHSSFQILPFTIVMYAPVLSPLLDPLSVGLRMEVWLIFASVRAQSIAAYTTHIAQWLHVWDLCLPVEANTLKVTISRRSGLPESPLCGQSLDEKGDLNLERLPLISVHKWLWWTLTSHSFDTAFLCNQFEYFLCFVLFPPLAIFASKTRSTVMSPWLLKQITFDERAVLFKFIFS